MRDGVHRTAAFLTVLGAVVACNGSRSNTNAPRADAEAADATVDAGKRLSTVLISGALDLHDARWASNGDVIASTHSGALRFAPVTDAPAKVLSLPEHEVPARLATARHADVIAIVTESRKLFVAREGAAFREIARVGNPATVDISDDGKLIAVDEPRELGHRTAGLRDATTGRQLRSFEVYARFDPSSKFVASSRLLASVDGSVPDFALKDEHFVVWVGRHAVLAGKNALVLVDPATRETKRIPMCGDFTVDVERARAVAACKGKSALEVVSLPSVERASLGLPAAVAANVHGIAGAREGDDVLLRYGGENSADPLGSAKLLRVDLGAKKTEDVTAQPPLQRDFADDPKLERELQVKPPHGRRSLTFDGAAKWPVRIRDARDHEIARWGPDSRPGTKVTVRAHDRGLDLERDVEHGAATIARVRIGPPALGVAEERVADSEMPIDTCVRDAHVRLTNGRMLFYPFDRQEWQPAACSCADFNCTKPFDALATPTGRVLDARADMIVVATADRDVKIRFVGPDGSARGSATIGDDATCKQARIAPDGRSAAFYCSKSDESRQEVIEVDVPTGKVLRKTPLRLPTRGLWTLEVASKGAIVFSPPRYGWMSPELVVVEPGTGRPLANVLALTTAAVARFDDGSVELFGEELGAERAIRCEEGGVLHPFSRCRAGAEVKSRFVLDLQ